MKISELIKELNEAIIKVGDVEILTSGVYPYSYGMKYPASFNIAISTNPMDPNNIIGVYLQEYIDFNKNNTLNSSETSQ